MIIRPTQIQLYFLAPPLVKTINLRGIVSILSFDWFPVGEHQITLKTGAHTMTTCPLWNTFLLDIHVVCGWCV